MPDNPTDKKVTFVEWLAKRIGHNKKSCKTIIQVYANGIINGKHTKDCRKLYYPCNLCILEGWLSEYHKYFKQNR